MGLQWLPWKYIVRRIARQQGFLDPIALMSRLERFAQPAEVRMPMEVMRISSVLQARGFINSQAIQHNLDWIWPYWVQQQFNPHSDSFIPRAFSLTHINLTHRNWTAVGLPDDQALPIVDPRGLLTPLFDGWSVDAWIIEQKDALIPAKLLDTRQWMDYEDGLRIVTESEHQGKVLRASSEMKRQKNGAHALVAKYLARSEHPGWLVISVRPMNPEGVSFINEIAFRAEDDTIQVNGKEKITFSFTPQKVLMSDYHRGDVYRHLLTGQRPVSDIRCRVGMATAAALFPLEPRKELRIAVETSIKKKSHSHNKNQASAGPALWSEIMEAAAPVTTTGSRFGYLYDASVRNLILHTSDDILAGPYTYRHFWFRDAAFIVFALIRAGFLERAKSLIELFLARQRPNGYFCSQDGEWDSNGQVLWVMNEYTRMTGEPIPKTWYAAMKKGADWIVRKRLDDKGDDPHAGLLPTGFSAEHLGPNDYYFWDNFWSIEGLQAAAQTARSLKNEKRAQSYEQEADSLMKAVHRALKHAEHRLGSVAMPSSPYRRLDSAVIGSIVAAYPLALFPADDPRIRASVDFLWEKCFVNNGFFHDMSHSGINPYLTLYVAEIFLKQGDPRMFEIMSSLADLASPTGQWPEAVHPLTKGGCMGDGQHAWAAAEWIIMLRNCFVYEMEDGLVIGAGIPLRDMREGDHWHWGPSPTYFGLVEVDVTRDAKGVEIHWKGHWEHRKPPIRVQPPGQALTTVSPADNSYFVPLDEVLA